MNTQQLPTRAAVALFQVALVQLLESAGVAEVALSDLVVNVNGRALRIDIARMTPDGQHIQEWLCGYSIDPRDLPTFGTPVQLPGVGKGVH